MLPYYYVLRGTGPVAVEMSNQELDSLHFTHLEDLVNLNTIWITIEPQ